MMSDPYDSPEEREECKDFITWLFSWTGDGGTFSTWRERHIAIEGAAAGARAGVFSELPPCPLMWADECQYFDGLETIFAALKGTTYTLVWLLIAITVFLAFGLVLLVLLITVVSVFAVGLKQYQKVPP
jgi:hypothetical protein